MKKRTTMLLAVCALAVVFNIVFGRAVSALQIPLLFLDTVGTIFIAAYLGMKYGVLVGFLTNFIASFFGSLLEIPFALVNIAVAIIVALMVGKRGTFTYRKAFITGLILGIVAPAIGTVIRIALFGGFTGSGVDIIIFALRASGQEIFQATFLATIAANMVDKILSCLLVSWLGQQKMIQNKILRPLT